MAAYVTLVSSSLVAQAEQYLLRSRLYTSQ